MAVVEVRGRFCDRRVEPGSTEWKERVRIRKREGIAGELHLLAMTLYLIINMVKSLIIKQILILNALDAGIGCVTSIKNVVPAIDISNAVENIVGQTQRLSSSHTRQGR